MSAITRPRFIASLFLTLALAVTSVGVLPQATAQDDRPHLRYGTAEADIQSLDPHYAVTYTDRALTDMIFNGLVRYTPGDVSEFEPDLATEVPEPEENDDGTQTWTFTLRDDVTCQAGPESDAYTFSSADALFSYEKAASDETSANAFNYAGISMDAPDDQTLVFNLEQPLSETLFLPKVADYAGGHVICQEAYEAMGSDAFVTHPVGTGPFMVESYTPQNAITLVANDDYFRGEPQLGGVEMRFIADPTSREFALQAGELDVINGLQDVQWVDRIDAMDGYTVDVMGVGEVISIHLNVEHEILQDPLVREAILHAIDRESHVALSGSPVTEPIYSVIAEDFQTGGLTEEEATEAGVALEYDPERSQELLAEAGYPDGFEMDLVTSELPVYVQNYEILQEELSQVGITVNLDVVQHAAMHDLIREEANPIVLYSATRPTTDQTLTEFHSSEGGSTNFSKLAVDELIVEARNTPDPDEQEALWKDINTQINAEFAATGIMFTNQVYARAENVDYGHELVANWSYYPGIDETTTLND